MELKVILFVLELVVVNFILYRLLSFAKLFIYFIGFKEKNVTLRYIGWKF